MSILFGGDTHGNMRAIAYLFEKAVANRCETIFQVGDFGYWPHDERGRLFLTYVDAHVQDTGVQFYFIDGNHENHDALNALPISDDGLRYLTVDGGLVHVPRGMVTLIDGLWVMGYGGAFSVDYKRRVLGVSYWPDETIDWEHCLTVCSNYRGFRPDILVTHDAPSGFEMGNVYKTQYPQTNRNRACLRTLMLSVNPGRVITGHWHERVTAKVDGFRIDVLDCVDEPKKDRRDSFLIVDGSHDRAIQNDPEAEVQDGASLQGAEGDLALLPA